jgi:hypothetical protein
MVMTKQHFPNNLLEDYAKLKIFADYLFGLSKEIIVDDRLALIIVFAAAEMIFDFLLGALCKHGAMVAKLNSPFMGKAILLSEIGVIDDKLFNNLNELKKLRNSAAHKPADSIKWKGKFAFNKKSDIYKKFVEDFGEPPQNLVGNILCVWNDLYMAGTRACTRKHINKLKTQKTCKKN